MALRKKELIIRPQRGRLQKKFGEISNVPTQTNKRKNL